MKMLFFLFLWAICVNANAQTLPPIPEEAKQFPNSYPPKEEMSEVHTWTQERLNHNVKIYAKTQFEALHRDDQAQLEGYGYLIVYAGKYLTWAEVQAYESRRSQIISRTYSEYKQYLYENNMQRFKELFD